MKKSVAVTTGVIIVAVGGWLAGTWYTGQRIETESQARLNEINAQLAAAFPEFPLRVNQLKLERGFFTSQARYGVEVGLSEETGKPEATVEVDARIEHGPFAPGALARGKLLPQLAFVHAEVANTDDLKKVFEVTKGATPLWSDTVVAYNGDSTSTGGLASIDYSGDEGKFTFSGATFDGSYQRATQAAAGSLKADNLVVDASADDSGGPLLFTLNGLGVTVDSRMGKSGLSIGDSALSIKRLEVKQPEGDAHLTMADMAYAARIGEQDEFVNGEISYGAGEITYNGIALGNGRAVFKAERLNAAAIKVVADEYNKAIKLRAEGKDPVPDNAEMRKLLMAQADTLLAGKPVLTLDPVQWKTAQGESAFNAKIALSKPASSDLMAVDYFSQAIESIDASATLSKPMIKALMVSYLQSQEGMDAQQAAAAAEQQVSSLAGMAEMMNLGKNQGDNIVSTFHYAAGTVDLNGRKMPAEQLLGSILGG